MPFDAKGFKTAKWAASTEDVPVEDLAAFYGDGEAPVWTVRALTGVELSRCREAVEKNARLKQMVEKLFSARSKDVVDAAEKIVIGPDVPSDIARRVEMLILGSVKPKCDLDLALKLCEHKPIVFHLLTNKILALTGIGSVPGGSKPSGRTTK